MTFSKMFYENCWSHVFLTSNIQDTYNILWNAFRQCLDADNTINKKEIEGQLRGKNYKYIHKVPHKCFNQYEKENL